MLSPIAQNPPSVFFLLSTLKPRKFQLSSAFRFLSSSLTFSCSLSSSSQISTQLILYNLGKSVGSPPLSQLSHQVHLLSFSQLPHLNILYPEYPPDHHHVRQQCPLLRVSYISLPCRDCPHSLFQKRAPKGWAPQRAKNVE